MLRRTIVVLVLVLAAVTGMPGILQSSEVRAAEDDLGLLVAPVLGEPREFQLEFTHVVENSGTSTVARQDLYLLVPQSNVNQTMLGITFDPQPTEFLTDDWGQKVAHYVITDMPGKSQLEVGWTGRVRLSDLSYSIDPAVVLDPADIPAGILATYTEDETRYDIYSPVVQSAAAEAVADSSGLYEQVRDTYQYVIDHLEYSREGGWDDAATVLERGDGSCTEYVFALIALLRANDIPAQHVGGSRLRADDDYLDTVFHRAVEVYLPEYGWVPMDVTLGDTQNDADAYFLARYGGHFIMSTAGGWSSLLGWNYHSNLRVADSSDADQISSSRSMYWNAVETQPVIDVQVSSDSAEYVATVDDLASFTAVVSDGNGGVVSGLAGGAFVSAVDGTAAPVAFVETSVSGTYTGALGLAALEPGEHELVLTVTDDATGTTATAAAAFTLLPAPEESVPALADLTMTMRTVSKVSGRNVFTNAVADIMVVDAKGRPLTGVTVSGKWSGLTRDTDTVVTNGSGVAVMQSDQVKKTSGTFTLTVTGVVVNGVSYPLQGDTVMSVSL